MHQRRRSTGTDSVDGQPGAEKLVQSSYSPSVAGFDDPHLQPLIVLRLATNASCAFAVRVSLAENSGGALVITTAATDDKRPRGPRG